GVEPWLEGPVVLSRISQLTGSKTAGRGVNAEIRTPLATRMTQTPPLLLRRYPSPRPFATRMNVGLIDTGNFNRAERVSRVDERIALAMPYPAFILPTYADKGERRRTRKSRWNAILSAYRVRLRPPTSGYSQRISSETPVTVVMTAHFPPRLNKACCIPRRGNWKKGLSVPSGAGEGLQLWRCGRVLGFG